MLKTEKLKQYLSLGELLKDYRSWKGYSQSQMAEILGIDNVEQISRWENDRNRITGVRDHEISRKLAIPFQVITNLNNKIPIYYNISNATYSLGLNIAVAGPFNDPSDFRSLDQDALIYMDNLRDQRITHSINREWIRRSGEYLPELNFCMTLSGRPDTITGICCALPLKFNSYENLTSRRMSERNLEATDLDFSLSSNPRVFFLYLLYGDSIESTYNVLSKVFMYFSTFSNEEYIVLTRAHDSTNLAVLRTLGLHQVEEPQIIRHDFPDGNTQDETDLFSITEFNQTPRSGRLLVGNFKDYLRQFNQED